MHRSATDLDPASAEGARVANWTRHWASGATHSCAGSFGELYGGSIAAFWTAAFSTLGHDDRLLDLATGNGALPRLMLQSAPATSWSCDAVDLAAVAPAWLGTLPAASAQRLRFHSAVRAEQLPFESGSMTWVVSQYGIEYSDLQQSLPELRRVLAPRGRVALVLHHARSRPVSLAAIEVAHLNALLQADGYFSAAQALLEPLSRARTPQGRASLNGDRQADAARERFNAAQDSLTATAQAAPDGADVLFEARDAVTRVIQTALAEGLPGARQLLEQLVAHFADLKFRLSELRAAALDDDAMAQLSHQLSGLGQVTRGELADNGYTMGWWLRTEA